MFEKLKFMQENVVGSAHLIHNSINELDRAINAAHTTLYNTINAFNALNFNKFLENVNLHTQISVIYLLIYNCRLLKILQQSHIEYRRKKTQTISLAT